MLDVFIIYEDDAHDEAARLAWSLTERGYRVWGDANHMRSASDEEIGAILGAARFVLTLWSPMARNAHWTDHARFRALDPERYVGIVIDQNTPLDEPWSDHSTITLEGKGVDAAALERIVQRCTEFLGPAANADLGEPAERLRALEEEAGFWRAVAPLNVRPGFTAYLDRFGDQGIWSALAKSRISEMQRRRVSSLLGRGAFAAVLVAAVGTALFLRFGGESTATPGRSTELAAIERQDDATDIANTSVAETPAAADPEESEALREAARLASEEAETLRAENTDLARRAQERDEELAQLSQQLQQAEAAGPNKKNASESPPPNASKKPRRCVR